MRPVLTPAEMGEADRRTIAAGTPVDVLMERAGRAVAWTVRREMGGTYGRRVVVVCGKGNNGGDGHVTARALREWGVRVDVFTLDAGVDRQLCERALLRADAFVVGGSGGMTGAPSFVSHAAMRAGAGIVWCGVPGEQAAARASGTEVITKALPATADGALDEPAAAEVLKAADRFRVLVVGPGLGRDDRTAAAVRRIVAEAPVPLVLDADGLNALAGDVGPLRARRAPAVLTPHAGEYVHLAGEKVGPDRLAAARRLAERGHAVVLLKGPGEVIADRASRAAINTTVGPWLATAGTGDVLSGIIGGFLARGAEPFWAATAGAFTHGRAADTAGHTGLVAGDLITEFPTAKPDDTLDGLAAEMHDRDITHVPVLDGGKLVGIVARGDLVRFLSRTS